MAASLEILESLRDLGISVRVVGMDKIRLQPVSKVPVALAARIREEKPAVLQLLRNRPSTSSLSCYASEPVASIHRPWVGCTTAEAEFAKPRQMVTAPCWHCRGEQTCGCSSCAQGWSGKPSDCVVCKGSRA
jgi:hypothetical protein